MDEQVDFKTPEETRMAFAGLLECDDSLEAARRVYNHRKGVWYRFHIPKLKRMGLVDADGKPLRTSQSLIYAYTEVPWEVAKGLSEEECRQAARDFLASVKVYGFIDYL